MSAPLVEFALWALGETRHGGDLDGGSLQEKAEALGILGRVPVTEPCGEECNCAEYGDFPQDCLRYADHVKALVA